MSIHKQNRSTTSASRLATSSTKDVLKPVQSDYVASSSLGGIHNFTSPFARTHLSSVQAIELILPLVVVFIRSVILSNWGRVAYQLSASSLANRDSVGTKENSVIGPFGV